jgi:protein-tyrosine phosphatase
VDWITETVAIGNYLEAQDTDLLRREGFRAALSLDGTLSPDHASGLGLAEVVAVRLVDGAGNPVAAFRHAVETLVRLAVASPPVLVQCHAGRSRSAVVVAGYLARTLDLDPDDALDRVAHRRPINVTPALAELLYRL